MSENNYESDSNVVVSIVIPILNEEKYIANCIESILEQDYPKEKLELVLVDGISSDDTLAIIERYKSYCPFIKVYSNPQKTVQFALNIGIMNAKGKYIVRMDAHSEYVADYVSKCIEFLEKTNAFDVGGPMIAKGKNDIQKVVAAAYHSPFALGGGKFHIENFEGYADTVFLGAFRKQDLIDIGLYDERLPRSEDDDLTFRINEAGYKVYITPQIKSVYYPRDSYSSLFKQYFEYGLWKVAVIKKHKKPARISHLIPLLFILFLLFFGLGSLIFRPIRYIFVIVMCLYIVLDVFFSFKNKYINSFKNKLRLMYVHFVLHFSYGIGFLIGIFKFFNYRW